MDTDATDSADAITPNNESDEQVAEASAKLTEQVLDAEKVDLVKDTPEEERIAHHSAEEALAAREAIADDGKIDIFAWANNMFQHSDQLKIDLFLINKNNVLYRTRTTPEIDKQL